MKRIFIVLAGLCTAFSVFAQTASFSTHDPLGRLVYIKDSGGKHYLGYFCLERSKVAEDNNKCLQAQFGMGEDVVLGVDFLGNPAISQGSWKAVGSVFSPESGQAFYHAALEGQHKAEFLEIWQNIWTREGYNWSSKPTQIEKSQWNAFISLLEKDPNNSSSKTDPMSYKEIKKVLADSYWNLAPWDGRVHVKYERGFEICINVSTSHKYDSLPNYGYRGLGWGESPCFSEKEKTLTYNENAQQFTATGIDGNPIVLSVIKKNNLVTLAIDMTMPAGSFYFNKEDNNKNYYYYSAQHVSLNLARKN